VRRIGSLRLGKRGLREGIAVFGDPFWLGRFWSWRWRRKRKAEYTMLISSGIEKNGIG
jgi:hypothetical protein